MPKIMFLGAAVIVALLAAGLLFEAVSEAWTGRRYPPPGRLVDVGGRRLHILCKGTADGPTVVIEQGAGSPSIFWWPIQDAVGRFARVCTYDRAGVLWSDPAPGLRSLDDRVDDLHALLARAQVPGPYVLVGHSYGGPLVRMFARRYPEASAGMVLVDTPEEGVIFRPAYPAYVRKLGQVLDAARLAARLGLLRLVLPLVSRPEGGVTPEMNRIAIGFMARPSFVRLMHQDMASLDTARAATERAGGFGSLGDRPLVVITHSKPFPGPAASLEDGWMDGQKQLAALSTDSELQVAYKSNHMINLEEPELVVDAIRRVVTAAREGRRLSSAPASSRGWAELQSIRSSTTKARSGCRGTPKGASS